MQLQVSQPVEKLAVRFEFLIAPGESFLNATQFRPPPLACTASSVVIGAKRQMTAESRNQARFIVGADIGLVCAGSGKSYRRRRLLSRRRLTLP